MADGSRHSMYLVAEDTYGVTPASPAFKQVRNTGTTLALTKNTVESEEVRPDRQIAEFRHGNRQVGGDISVEFSYGSFDEMMEAVLCGSWTADKPAAGTDELKAGSKRRSFSVLRHFSDLDTADKPYHLFNGVELNNFSLTVAPDAIVKATFAAVGKGMVTAGDKPASATLAAPTTTGVMDSFTGTLKENGAPIAVVTEVQLTLENGIEPRFVVGSKETIQPRIGRSNLTGQITAYFENSALLDKFLNETESSLEFTLPDAAGNQYTFILPRVKYNGGQPDVSGQGDITLAMPFQALFDSTAGSNLVVQRKAV
ncbi:MAG: phage tail tube protein [Endozoicomonas sp.]